MPINKLPPGGNDFRISGISGFARKFSNLTRFGQFSNLKNNKNEAIKIFESLVPTIRRNGKVPLSTRQKMARRFARVSGTTKQDERDFRKILDIYK